MTREEIIAELEGTYGTACYDDETTDELRQCLQECQGGWLDEDEDDPDE